MLKQQQTKREDFANLSDINENSLAQYADGFIAIIIDHQHQYPL